MKVYITGNIVGSYRAQNIIKALADSNALFVFQPQRYFRPNFRSSLFNRLLSIFGFIVLFPARIYLIVLSSHLFVLPMNWSPSVLIDVVLAKLFGKKIIVDFYISIYDRNINDYKEMLKDSIRGKLSLFKDKLLLNYSTRIIFLNNSESAYYQKATGTNLDPAKIIIIPLCIDYKKESLLNESINTLRDDNGLSICWWGSYIPLHGLDNIIESFTFLTNIDVRLYLLGDSEEKSKKYRVLIDKLDLSEKIQVRNDISFSNGKLAPFLIKNCDIALGNFGTSGKARTVLVNKIVDAFSLGIPCLTMPTKATKELFKEEEGLLYCNPDPESIAHKIIEALDIKDDLKNIGCRGKEAYISNFTPDAFRLKLLAALESDGNYL